MVKCLLTEAKGFSNVLFYPEKCSDVQQMLNLSNFPCVMLSNVDTQSWTVVSGLATSINTDVIASCSRQESQLVYISCEGDMTHVVRNINIWRRKKNNYMTCCSEAREVLAMMWLSLVTKGQSPSWKESKHIDSWIHCLLCGLQSEFTQHLIVHIQQGIKTYRDC